MERLDCCTIGEETDFFEGDAFAKFERLDHGVGVVCFYTNDLDVGSDTLNINTDTSDQSTTSYAAEDSFELAQIGLTNEFHANSALASNNIGIVKRRNVSKAVSFGKTTTFCFRSIKVCAV
jgi:hypothetical protein